mmetsp:Transcript_67803/g.163944  ORF Transcript_67803/g.163944 Transcript_67803/m.163944 type:complete len:201 (+) Transcript_67803:817-1419(+)
MCSTELEPKIATNPRWSAYLSTSCGTSARTARESLTARASCSAPLMGECDMSWMPCSLQYWIRLSTSASSRLSACTGASSVWTITGGSSICASCCSTSGPTLQMPMARALPSRLSSVSTSQWRTSSAEGQWSSSTSRYPTLSLRMCASVARRSWAGDTPGVPIPRAREACELYGQAFDTMKRSRRLTPLSVIAMASGCSF